MRISDAGSVRTVCLDAPPANALNLIELAAFEAVLDELEDAVPHVGAVVFRGVGRFFCAGVDIGMISESARRDDGTEWMISFAGRLQAAFERLERLPLPTVAALRGPATGGGLELALACDFRVSAEDARFGLPEIKLGRLPGAGGTQRLTEVAGRAVAARLILRGELVTGQEAERLGVVQWAMPADDVEPFAADLAEELTAHPRHAVVGIKRCLASARREDGFAMEIDYTRDLMDHPESQRLLDEFLSGKSSAREGAVNG